jgi:hypothetical protein
VFGDTVEIVEENAQKEELGDPSEANALFGAPPITLDAWFKMPTDSHRGLPH